MHTSRKVYLRAPCKMAMASGDASGEEARRAYVQSVRSHAQVLPQSSEFGQRLARTAGRLWPYRLEMQPEKRAISNLIVRFTTEDGRQHAKRLIQALQVPLNIHPDLVDAATNASMDLDTTQLKSAVFTALGLTAKQCGAQAPVFLSALTELQQREATNGLRQCGDMSLEEATMFCFGRIGGKAYLHLRMTLLEHTGFQHSDLLRPDMEFFWNLRGDWSAVTPKGRSNGLSNFYHYALLAKLLQEAPKTACVRLTSTALAAAFQGIGQSFYGVSSRSLFSCLCRVLRFHSRPDVVEDLHLKLHPHLTHGCALQWLSGRSLWHAGAIQQIQSALAESASRTAFRDNNEAYNRYTLGRLLLLLQEHAATTFQHQVAAADAPGGDALRWFIENCTLDMAVDACRALLRAKRVMNERVKSCHEIHHGAGLANYLVRAFKVGIAAVQSCDRGLGALSAKSVLRGAPNERVAADGATRRTFTDDEIQAMFEACKHDARESLLLRLLREIGLRAACLAHLKYFMLIDQTHTPRHVCRVPEKGCKWRSFVTSFPLKQAIKRYCETLRDCVATHGDIYIFSTTCPQKPPSQPFAGDAVKRIARKAGITDVVVHPHAFRHTIVGQLIDAGNSMEIVSKSMGHASLATTAVNYWVPTAFELHDKLKNPFTGQFQQSVKAADEAKEKLELVYDTLDAALKMLCQQNAVFRTAAANGASASDALQHFEALVPDAEQILRGIVESTSASMSATRSECTEHAPGAAGAAQLSRLETLVEDQVDSSDDSCDSAEAEDEGSDAEVTVENQVAGGDLEVEARPPTRKRKSRATDARTPVTCAVCTGQPASTTCAAPLSPLETPMVDRAGFSDDGRSLAKSENGERDNGIAVDMMECRGAADAHGTDVQPPARKRKC